MQGFADIPRQPPTRRAPEKRVQDFAEIYAELTPQALHRQSERCAQCGVPFCQSGCPLHNSIPDWLAMAAAGQEREAWRLSAATNPLPEICGRICPQDRLCEGACVPGQAGLGAITIGAVETALTETAWREGWISPIRPARESGHSVAIMGSGPAGLAAAAHLRTQGFAVAIYERADRPGGLLTYGIPAFKLDKEMVRRRTGWLAQSDVVFHLNCEVGRDISLDTLRSRHSAVLLAGGVSQARRLNVPGASDALVHPAMDYLTCANRIGFGETVADFATGRLDAKGRHVVVIGGGDTAMDCVRTAVRQHAASVTCLYRRDEANMPGSHRELQNARDEGVLFHWLGAPRAVQGKAARAQPVRPRKILAVRMQLGARRGHSRARPEEIPGSDFGLRADMIIAALGFTADDVPAALAAPDLRTATDGVIVVDGPGYATSLPGVYAAGDCVRGASLVVWAIRQGQDAAAQIVAEVLGREQAA